MSAKIKHIIEKPEWFDLDNYKDAYDADLGQWLDNLFQRVHAFYILDGRFPKMKGDNRFNNPFVEQAYELRIKGFVIRNKGNSNKTSSSKKYNYTSNIDSLNTDEVVSLYDDMPEKIRSESIEVAKEENINLFLTKI